jgi:serine/threonine protein kinase
MVQDFAQQIRKELDFLRDGRNADRMSRNFRDVPGIRFPRIYWEYSTPRLLVMEFVPGFSLSDYLFLREKLSEEEAWEILRQVASALDYAHTQKVIHRDVKPSNILFKTEMTVQEVADYYKKEGKFPDDLAFKVADFGIARTVSDSISRLSNMPVSGTLTYMSSEQIRGKRQTQVTDVYSLAVVAYELLCGHPPFYQGEITYQIINESPDPISTMIIEFFPHLPGKIGVEIYWTNGAMRGALIDKSADGHYDPGAYKIFFKNRLLREF